MRANYILCGNDAGDGWDIRFSDMKRSLQPHFSKTFIKLAPQTPLVMASVKKVHFLIL